VLVVGPERLFAERAVAAIVGSAGADRQAEVTRLDAASARRGDLRAATSPSLFAEPSVVVVEQFESMGDDMAADAVEYAASYDPQATVVFLHSGAVRGKKALEALRSAGAAEYLCPAVRKDSEVVEFVAAEFARAGASARAEAVRALVDAVGADVAELAAAVGQLAGDVSGEVTAEAVARYYGSRVTATGFSVADAAVAGRTGEALALVRHALETGTDPVPLVAALASKLRTLAKVGAARGRGLDPARDLGLAPWQVDRARRELRHWSAGSLAVAIDAVAAADAEVKGAGRDPRFAVERAVRVVAQQAGEGR
jgi:DNA polymerase-3 subunit delta